MRAIVYRRVSTDKQARSGLGLDAQLERTAAYCAMHGWEIVASLVDDGVSSALPMSKRPGITEALRMLQAGEADAIVASKLDRMTRSLMEADHLIGLAQRQGFKLVAIDMGLDTSTSGGRLVARIIAAVAQWEREAIGERTSEALQAKKAAGVRLGAPRTITAGAENRLRQLREDGYSVRAIAAALSREGFRTPRGERIWSPSTVHAVLSRDSSPEHVARP